MQPRKCYRKKVKLSSSGESMATGFSHNTDGAEDQKRSINDKDDNDEANVQAPTKRSDDPLEQKLQDLFEKHGFADDKKQRLLEGLKESLGSDYYKKANTDGKRLLLSAGLRAFSEFVFRVSEEGQKEFITRLLDGEGNTRIAKITDGLDIKLAHKFDVEAFVERVDELFAWHDNENVRNEYRAPYFPLVQSSGMGKTRLLHEARTYFNKRDDTVCLAILCTEAKLDQSIQQKYFDEKFTPYPSDTTLELHHLLERLKRRLKQKKAKRAVLLFDEAHALMTDNDWGNEKVSRTIQWWLRAYRYEADIVAVFAGTNPKLANFSPTCPPIGTSREVRVHYKNYVEGEESKKKLYPPFFKLHTISCLRKRQPSNATTTADPGFPHAALYGRPLFAHYYLKGDLDEKMMAAFAKRLVLSATNYEDKLLSCYSVLGTRVQMGTVTSFERLSALVSGGYGCLVDFKQEIDTSSPRGWVSFMSDPVCATLAMRLMDSEWREGKLEGHDKKFWTEQAARAFTEGICIPDKGDGSETFAALYMLFCGDVLRKKNDVSNGRGLYSNFVVSLDDWFSLLMNGGKEGCGDDGARGDDQDGPNVAGVRDLVGITSTISFVQVCRNEFRSLSLCEAAGLEYMYQSGRANYAFKNCRAVDIYASIRVVTKDSDYRSKVPPPSR